MAALHDGVCDVAGLHIPMGLAQKAALLDMLRSDAFRAEVDALPGYSPDHIGRVTPLHEAFGSAAAGR